MEEHFFYDALFHCSLVLFKILELEQHVPPEVPRLPPLPPLHGDELLAPVTHDGGAAKQVHHQEVDSITAQREWLR